MPRGAWLILFFVWLWPASVQAVDPDKHVTQYAHTAWKIREGFAKGTIFSIAQTADGYLWLGTDYGLLHFDGVRNVAPQLPPDQPLPSARIGSLLAARDGTLWIGTSKGLASWKGSKLTQYGELAGQIILTLLEDGDGAVWAGVVGFPAGMYASMYHDYAKGGPIEIEGMSGHIVREGRRLGVPTPHHATIYALLKPHRAGTPAT